jgi:hypothetical protein
MNTWSSPLVAAAGLLLASLGSIHLVYTFGGPKLLPRDPALIDAMRASTLRITRETDVWRAWIGFNASHSIGAIGFGVLLAWLALAPGTPLLQSALPQVLAAGMLGGYALLARRYWFSIPRRGITLALLLYAAGLIGLHLPL